MKEKIIEITRLFAIRCIETGGWTQEWLETHADEILALLAEPIDYASIDPVKWGELTEAAKEYSPAGFHAFWEMLHGEPASRSTLQSLAKDGWKFYESKVCFTDENTYEDTEPSCPEELKEAYKAIREVREALLKLERSYGK